MSDFSFSAPDGKVYHLGKLRQSDIIEFHKWVQYRPYFQFQSMKDAVDPDVFNRQSEVLLKECSHKSKQQVNDEAEDWQNSMEGGSYLIYRSLRRNHEKLTEQDVSELITDDNAPEIMRLLKIMNNPIGDDESKKKTDLGNHSTPPCSIEPVSNAG